MPHDLSQPRSQEEAGKDATNLTGRREGISIAKQICLGGIMGDLGRFPYLLKSISSYKQAAFNS